MREARVWWTDGSEVAALFSTMQVEGAKRLGTSVLDDRGLGLVLEIHAFQDGVVLELEREPMTHYDT
jgi:hypothetical protein